MRMHNPLLWNLPLIHNLFADLSSISGLISDEFLKRICSRFGKIAQTLVLDGCHRITGKVFSTIAASLSLRSISLKWCNHFSSVTHLIPNFEFVLGVIMCLNLIYSNIFKFMGAVTKKSTFEVAASSQEQFYFESAKNAHFQKGSSNQKLSLIVRNSAFILSLLTHFRAKSCCQCSPHDWTADCWWYWRWLFKYHCF